MLCDNSSGCKDSLARGVSTSHQAKSDSVFYGSAALMKRWLWLYLKQ